MTDPYFLGIVVGALVGGGMACLVVLMGLSSFVIRPTIKITQVDIAAALVEAWLEQRKLVACPKGPDFKPAVKARKP